MFCPIQLLYFVFVFSILQGVTADQFFLVSLRHSDLEPFSAINSDTGHVMVLLFTGSDVTINITAHIVKYTPKGMLHGNHKVSLSRGFVKCNIIQRRQGHQKEGTAQCCWNNRLFPTLHIQIVLQHSLPKWPKMSLIYIYIFYQ